jgi:hypothetical protein
MKATSKIVIFLTAILLCSCIKKHAVNNNPQSDTSKIINMVIDTLTIERYLQENISPRPSRDEAMVPNKEFIMQAEKVYKKRTDSLIKKLNTDKYYVGVLDSLIALPSYEIEYTQSNNRFKQQFGDIDVSYKALLLNISRPQDHSIDVSKIRSKYRFIINGSELDTSQADKLNIGWIELSNISFNNDKTKACIYAAISKGHFGYGYIYFLEKSTNNWRFVKVQPE